jgi:hypothetical protein
MGIPKTVLPLWLFSKGQNPTDRAWFRPLQRAPLVQVRQISIDGSIIDDDQELTRNFVDIVRAEKNFKNNAQTLGNKKISFLARTTTPRTLPSNMFLTVGPEILYAIIFDHQADEYFILAHDLIKNFFKNEEDYTLVYILNGKELL